jgi:hypothetical protein
MFLFFHDKGPWMNPKVEIDGKLEPMTEHEIRTFPWRRMHVGMVMKHRLYLNCSIKSVEVRTWPLEEQRVYQNWNARRGGKIFFEPASDICIAMAMCHHNRLGRESGLKVLSPELIQSICGSRIGFRLE